MHVVCATKGVCKHDHLGKVHREDLLKVLALLADYGEHTHVIFARGLHRGAFIAISMLCNGAIRIKDALLVKRVR